MTNRYEVVYIFDSSLEEPQVNEHLEKFHALLKTAEKPEPVRQVNHWGKRQLAYSIKGRDVGYYAVVQFDAEARQLAEFERLIKLDESVLRHLIVIDEGATPAVLRAPSEEVVVSEDAGADEGDE
jgi:small subunit ribosomal protein S6